MSIVSEIERIQNGKEKIKQAMIKRGVNVGEERLNSYPYLINLIGDKKYQGDFSDIDEKPEILRLQLSKDKMINVLNAKGVNLPYDATLDNIADAIGKI